MYFRGEAVDRGALRTSTAKDKPGTDRRPIVIESGESVPDRDHLIPSRAVLVERRLRALTPAPATRSRVKRALDVTISAIALIVLAPVMGVVAAMVRLSSPGPALFRQERVGLCGIPFTLWKFRTMVVGADEQLGDLLDEHQRTASPLFKVPNDPRVTSVGRFLRRLSLDELPQLVNVLRGDMSLVGPRPQRLPEVELYEGAHFPRLTVRPGLTGPWQVSGRSNLGWEQAVELDLDYVRHWTLGRDLVILRKTVRVVVSGDGAE